MKKGELVLRIWITTWGMNSEFYRDPPTNNMPLAHKDNHIFIFLLCEFDFLKEHGCVSVIFVTDGRNMYHAPSIRQLVQRSGQEVPQLLDAMADLAKQASLWNKIGV